MSRKLCLERLETRDTPSAVGVVDPLSLPLTPAPISTPALVAPINLAPLPTNSTTVVIGISLAPDNTSLGTPYYTPSTGTPPAPVGSPVLPLSLTPYLWLITPV